MATSKTLTPTNVTIQIPEFTDQPDQRVNSNCIDKEADAINALDAKISSFGYYTLSNETTLTSSYETINTYNSRKFSDYDLLVVVYYRGAWITGSDVVIMNQFIGMTGITKYILYDNVGIEYDVKFTSDTSFDCKKITTDTATERIKLYGLNIDISG